MVFGSRARGDYKTTSDIDIAILGKCDDNIEFNIKNEFDLIDTFYMFDIVFYEDLKDEKFKKSIEQISIKHKFLHFLIYLLAQQKKIC